MKCETCKKKATQKITNHVYCDQCFNNLIEKRIRKQIRASKQFENSGRITIIDNNTIQSKLNIHFIKKIITNPKITFKNSKIKDFDINKYDLKQKTIIPHCLDDEIKILLDKLIKKTEKPKKTRQKPENKIIILKTVTTEELKAYAKINKISYEKTHKKTGTSQFIDDMEKKYPGTKHSLLKSINELEGII